MLTRTFIWTWMFSLLLSTVGVSMHAVYCYCLGESTMQFLPVEHDCKAEEEVAADDCCKKKEPVKPSAKLCCETTVEKPGCMKTTMKVFVLKTDLQVEKSALKVFDIQDFGCLPSFDYPPLFFLADIGSIHLNKAPPESPPSLSGRDICLRHAIFRC